jgi:outer membrane protein OmpA-like peptidoglycan-associated protein/tetratricopeptide (TPR) repeat protein
MALRFLFILAVLVNSSAILLAQGNNAKEVKRFNEEAYGFFQTGQYQLAVASYLKAQALSPDDPGVNYSIAICYIKSYQAKYALPYLERARKGGIPDPEMDYYFGVSYHQLHRIDEAIASIQIYKKHKDADHVKAQLLLDYCHHAKHYMANPVKMNIRNLASVNSSEPDYNPSISIDESTLIFTSRREGSTGGQKDPRDNYYFEDIFLSNKNEDSWSSPSNNLGTGINSTSHDGCIGLSPDGQTMFIYKTDNGGDIYYAQLKGNQWSSPVNMGANVNSKEYETGAALSPDGRYFFFVSNRKGGFGGLDLYVSERQANGTYGVARNLGDKINTVMNETSPYVQADGKALYFSSELHKSMGGFDIFSVPFNPETGNIIGIPENLGYPINTADDEINFVWSADNKRAYFASVREDGIGEKDIYILERPEAKAALVMLKGTVVDCITQNAIAASIKVTDNATGKEIGTYATNSSSGRYVVVFPAGKNYGITVEAEGYAFYSKNIDIPHLVEYREMDDLICMQNIKAGTKIILHNVFFDIDQASLRPESETELKKLVSILTANKELNIQIVGHTDGDGDAEHNLKLSEDRAHAVKDYLIANGIAQDRISYKGMGETQPLVANDSPEGKQQNRRTEIMITP